MSNRDQQAPVLFIFSGLPGSGKSTLAQAVVREAGAVYVRIDTIEQALRDVCGIDVKAEGYALAYRVALDNLRLGLNVVSDSCNPIGLTRREWAVTRDAGATCCNIEVICTDTQEHRKRVESRSPDVRGLKLPTWGDVQRREYHEWTSNRLVIDTAGRTVGESQAELLGQLRATGLFGGAERQGI